MNILSGLNPKPSNLVDRNFTKLRETHPDKAMQIFFLLVEGIISIESKGNELFIRGGDHTFQLKVADHFKEGYENIEGTNLHLPDAFHQLYPSDDYFHLNEEIETLSGLVETENEISGNEWTFDHNGYYGTIELKITFPRTKVD